MILFSVSILIISGDILGFVNCHSCNCVSSLSSLFFNTFFVFFSSFFLSSNDTSLESCSFCCRSAGRQWSGPNWLRLISVTPIKELVNTNKRKKEKQKVEKRKNQKNKRTREEEKGIQKKHKKPGIPCIDLFTKRGLSLIKTPTILQRFSIEPQNMYLV